MWKDLSLKDKSALMQIMVNNGIYDLSTIRDTYNKFAEGGKKDSTISDKQYYDIMERVAEENYQRWGYNNPDEALLNALNDNTYNYREYYNKYPQSKANADTHWTDEFKTVYHPTFSDESIYSGKKSQYNPKGKIGGHWIGETYIPNFFDDGGEKDTYFGLTTDDWKDVGLGIIPVVGTYRDFQTFMEDPTLVNGLGLGISAVTDAATLFGIGAAAKGARALYKAYKAKKAISAARQLAAKQATKTYKQTKSNRVTGTATNKQVKSSIQSMITKKQNAELARQKADFANTLFLDYTKREAIKNIKKITNPLSYDTEANIFQNWWNTNL